MKWEGVLRKYPFGLSGDFAEFYFLRKSGFLYPLPEGNGKG